MNLSPAYQSLGELWEQPPSFCNYLQDEVILSSKSCQTISVNDFSLLWFASTRGGTNPVLQLPLHSVSLGQRLRTWGQRVAAPLSGALGSRQHRQLAVQPTEVAALQGPSKPSWGRTPSRLF